MKIETIAGVLKSIRNKYAQIRRMTETLDGDSNPETYRKVLDHRALLLSDIEKEQIHLDSVCSHWRKQCERDPVLAAIKSEIQLLISAAVALDSAIQEKLADKISEMKTEVCNLGKTAKVALSYARHNR